MGVWHELHTGPMGDFPGALHHAGIELGEPDLLVGLDSLGEVSIITVEEVEVIAGGSEETGVNGPGLALNPR